MLIGAVTLVLGAGAFGSGMWYEHARHPHLLEPVHERAADGRIPGEFEHQDALLLGFNELIQFHPETLVQIVSAVRDNIAIVGIVRDVQQRQQVLDLLQERGIPTRGIRFMIWPVESMWVQDYGPIFSVGKEPRLLDFDYPHARRNMENLLPAAIASRLGIRIDHCELALEGGNVLSNGAGLCVTTTAIIGVNQERGFDIQQIAALLKERFQFNAWSYLVPLEGEPLAHVDMFMTFVSPNTAVVGRANPAEDPVNAKILDENAAILSQIQTTQGPMRVFRVERPPHRDDKWRTYCNVIFANGVLLVPQYPTVSPELDRAALAVFQQALPGWKIVGIDCTSLIEKRGALHCISLSLPYLPSSAELD